MTREIAGLYQRIVLEHCKRPRNFGVLKDANRKVPPAATTRCAGTTSMFM
jgi:hypothetical protein